MDVGIMGSVSTHILVLYEHRNTSAVFAVASHKEILCFVTVLHIEV
jgi:hypothetical protein